MKNHIIIILTVAISVLLLTGQIEYQSPQYSGSDLHKYISMAETSPDLNLNVIRPYVYRILVPWIVGLMPFSIPANFLLLNVFFLPLLALVFYFVLIEFKLKPETALVLTITFQLNKYFYLFLAWDYFQVCDTISLAVLFSSLILIKRKQFLFLFLILPLSILAKEYALIIIPAGLLYYLNQKNTKNFFIFSAVSLAVIGVYTLIRISLNVEGGVDLLTQYTTKQVYTTRIMLFLKKYIASFTPFGLLPVLFYKDLFRFFKQNLHFLVYTITVIIISYFGEAERMMAPLAPVYFLFVGDLLDKVLNIKTFNFYFLIIVISLLSSFYHLWGIILLPDKNWSMISTVVFSAILGYIFYTKKNETIHYNIQTGE